MTEAADTSEAIVASAASLLPETMFDEITYRQLGEAVGVSERTVYRHFPTRSHLLAEVACWLEQRYFPLPAFTTWEGFDCAVEQRFQAYDAAPAYAFVMARAESISPVGNAHPNFFTETVSMLIETQLPRLNARDAGRLGASLCYFGSPQFWARCRTGFDMDATATTQAFRCSAGQVLQRLPGLSPIEQWVDGAGQMPGQFSGSQSEQVRCDGSGRVEIQQ